MIVSGCCRVTDMTKKGLTVKRRSRPSGPKLTVLSAREGQVECQLETNKMKTVFQFNLGDTVPADVANNLVREKLLPSAHAELITELLKDLVRQLKETPEKLPVLDSTGSPIRKPRVYMALKENSGIAGSEALWQSQLIISVLSIDSL
ncbi:negative regulation of pancreatic juice secretion [Homalodisca vitripennis]|nr:negative regulation of pancreatic juice secretion [Homalodisca vitripennis]